MLGGNLSVLGCEVRGSYINNSQRCCQRHQILAILIGFVAWYILVVVIIIISIGLVFIRSFVLLN